MKTKAHALLAALSAGFLCALFALLLAFAIQPTLHAQTTDSPAVPVAATSTPAPATIAPALATTPAAAGDLTATLVSFIEPTVVKYPWISTALIIVGLLRTLFKPIVSFLEARAAATADTADDERLRRAEASWWFKALAWALDFTASIKVGPQRK